MAFGWFYCDSDDDCLLLLKSKLFNGNEIYCILSCVCGTYEASHVSGWQPVYTKHGKEDGGAIVQI